LFVSSIYKKTNTDSIKGAFVLTQTKAHVHNYSTANCPHWLTVLQLLNIAINYTFYHIFLSQFVWP